MNAIEKIDEMRKKMKEGKPDVFLDMIWVGRDYSVQNVIDDLKEIREELNRSVAQHG